MSHRYLWPPIESNTLCQAPAPRWLFVHFHLSGGPFRLLSPFAVPKSVGKFCSTNHMKPQNRLERIPPRQSSGVWYGKKGRVLVVLNSQYQMLTPALNDPLIEQSTHFPLRMLNLLAMTPPPTANQSNLRFCFEALSSTSPSTGTDQPPAPLRLDHYDLTIRRSAGGPAVGSPRLPKQSSDRLGETSLCVGGGICT